MKISILANTKTVSYKFQFETANQHLISCISFDFKEFHVGMMLGLNTMKFKKGDKRHER